MRRLYNRVMADWNQRGSWDSTFLNTSPGYGMWAVGAAVVLWSKIVGGGASKGCLILFEATSARLILINLKFRWCKGGTGAAWMDCVETLPVSGSCCACWSNCAHKQQLGMSRQTAWNWSDEEILRSHMEGIKLESVMCGGVVHVKKYKGSHGYLRSGGDHQQAGSQSIM